MECPCRILVIEDERNLLNSLTFILENAGFLVSGAASGEEGVSLVEKVKPDLVLLDIGLPGMDGFEVAERLQGHRRCRGMRIVMVTGRDYDDDIVRAFETCADDYVVKPVRPRTLLARLRALSARTSGPSDPASDERFWLKDVCIDRRAFEARRDGVSLGLTRTEMKILMLFAKNPNKALARLEIIRDVHGRPCAVSERSIDFQIHGLRKKLGDLGQNLETVRGVGFIFRFDG